MGSRARPARVHQMPQSHIQQQGGSEETLRTPRGVDATGSLFRAFTARRYGGGGQTHGLYLFGTTGWPRESPRSHHHQWGIIWKPTLPAHYGSVDQYGERYTDRMHYNYQTLPIELYRLEMN